MDGDVTILVAGDERAATALAAVTEAAVERVPHEATDARESADGREEGVGAEPGEGADSEKGERVGAEPGEGADSEPGDGSSATAESVRAEGVAEAFTDQDAVVVAGRTLSDRAVAAVERVPVVVYAAEQPTAAWIDGFVRRTDGEPDGRRLRDEVDRALNGETRIQLRTRRRQLARLHDGAAYLASARSESELYDRTVSVAADVVTFDTAVLLLDRGDRFERVAGTTGTADGPVEEAGDDGRFASVETGARADGGAAALARETLEAGTPRVVDEEMSVLSVPIGTDAVIQARADRSGAFDATDLELAQLLATHARETRERLRAEADARERRERIATLHEAATDLIDADGETAVLARTVEIATEVLELDHCLIAEATADGFYARAVETPLVTAGERVADRSEGLLAVTFERDEGILEADIETNPAAEPADDSFAAALSVPFPEVGVFQAVSQEAGTYDESDLELAELLVSYASTTVERVRSARALRESRQTVERLYEAAADVAAAETEGEVTRRAVAAAEEVLSLDRCALSLVDEAGEQLVPVAASQGTKPQPMSVEEGLTGRTYRTGETVVVDDLHANSDAEPTEDAYRSAISVPVGEEGVFQAVATETAAFDEADADRAELLMAHVAVALGQVRAEAGLREERDRFSALFENIPDAVVAFEMVDGDPIVRDVNAAFEETFGYGEREVVGENVDDYIAPPDVELETPAGELNRRLRDGENIRLEVQRVTADGLRDFLMYVVPLEVGAENVAGFAIYSDITERKERERELRRQNERLDEFASVVSHDLRNPISIADGYLEMAQQTGEDQHFRKVQTAIDRMDALVEDLLELAREGEIVGDPEPVALTDVADTAWRHVDTADATLELQGALTVEADGDRLAELFENLFRNAVEHGGDAVTVRVVPTDEGFAVADDGPGIPEDDREAVFEAGVTTTDDGTGFGLPIVR
ncbi:MAG: GAF domain-containing protein, partial [Halobaculum sp.]